MPLYNAQISSQKMLFTFLIVLMGLANVYVIPGTPLGIGELLFVLFAPFFVNKNISCSLQNGETGFIIWFIYTFFVTLFVLVYVGAPISKFFSILRVAFYWGLMFVLGKSLFDYDFFKRGLFVFTFLLSSLIVVQFFVFTITGFYIPGYLLNATLNDGGVTGYTMYQGALLYGSILGFVRPSGFLCEPAHCAQFLIVPFAIVMTDPKLYLKKKVLLMLLISAIILITASSTGVAMLLFLWILYIVTEKKLSFIRVPLIVFLSLFLVSFVGNGGGTEFKAVDRLLNLFNGQELDNSSNVRLNKGFEMYSFLPFSMKLFGSGIGLFDYLSTYFNFENSLNCQNAFAGTFFMSGIIGAIIFYFSMGVLFVKAGLLGKTLVCGYFVLSLGTGIFCCTQMVWIFLVILADIREKNEISST